MGTKIQLNSLSALERLIGGDTELEVEIRNSVVQEFAKKHLKCIADNEIASVEGNIRRSIREQIDSLYGKEKYGRFGYYYELSEDQNKAIRERVDECVNEAIKERLSELNLTELIDRSARSYIFNAVDKYVKEESIRDAIRAGVKEKISSIMKEI